MRAAEPVVTSTNHGSASAVIWLPVVETVSAARSARTARLRSALGGGTDPDSRGRSQPSLLACARMPTADELRSRIESSLPGAVAQVLDTTGTQDHFYAHVVAPQFAGLSLIEQHKLVYEAVGYGSDASIHAFSMKTSASS